MTAPAVLPLAEVDALEAATRANLSDAIGNLARLRELGAHSLRGHDTWHAYVLDRFGDLLAQLHLPVEERRALVASMTAPTAEHPKGMPVRGIAEKLSVSKSTVANDRRALADVVSLADRRQAEPEPEAPQPSSVDLVVAAVARARDGYTVHEAARRLGWRQGQASCALSRAEKRGRLVRTGRFRDGCAIYAVQEQASA